MIDQVKLADGLVLPKQSIGAATLSEGFDGVDGILGYILGLYYLFLNLTI